MGTTWSVTCVADPALDARPIETGIRRELDRIVAQMSPWVVDSDISRFNHAPEGSWHALPDEFFTVLTCALALARRTRGAYDPTIGRLVDLWGFGPAPAHGAPPEAGDIRAARERGGWERIAIDAGLRRARQPGGVHLDFSSIAKGFAVDRVARYLALQGIRHHLVEIGGELRGAGVKQDGSPWWVRLDVPHPQTSETLVALHGLSVATSGDERAFVSEGRRYAHTIDPRTGYPVEHDVVSVVVLHADCMRSDAFATALMVLGADAGMRFAREENIAALIVSRRDDGFAEHASPAFLAMAE